MINLKQWESIKMNNFNELMRSCLGNATAVTFNPYAVVAGNLKRLIYAAVLLYLFDSAYL